MTKRIDETGNRYGRLVVTKYNGPIKGYATWLCQCDCGETSTPRGSDLRTGRTKSCGCGVDEWRKSGDANRTHGLSSDTAWQAQYASLKRARKKSQTPEDADFDKINYMYNVCRSISQIKGKPYQVDHIYPISKGGPHHQDNLQILDGVVNATKYNKTGTNHKGITMKILNNIKEVLMKNG
jgi:5-methylcytosine-specific restriction endonuclease McrA